jgi:hypothetical protein
MAKWIRTRPTASGHYWVHRDPFRQIPGTEKRLPEFTIFELDSCGGWHADDEFYWEEDIEVFLKQYPEFWEEPIKHPAYPVKS